MALFIAEDTDSTFVVRPGENTLQAAASALTAEGWADAAALSAATAEAAAGPTYASTAAGLAATTNGEAFAVDAGGGLVSVYLNSSGTAVLQRTLATTGALAASGGSALVGFIQSGTGATARTLQAKARDLVSVKDFGAVGNGVADDTAAIAAADVYARSIGAKLYFPAGTYMVSQLVLYTNSNWFGDGRDATIIKQIVGSNTDLLYGVNSNSCWGVTTPTDFAVGFTLRNLTLDGNRSGGNTAGSGLAAFVARPIMENVFIKNCAEHGMRTEYVDAAFGGIDTWAMEGHFSNVRIDTVGKHGWWNNGPHDSVDVNTIVIDASQAAANTYSGFYFGTRSNGRHVAAHAWTRSTSVRAKAALEILSGTSGHDFVGGCNFEGGYTANVIMAGTQCNFDSTTRYYAAWNGLNILLTGPGCTINTIMGKLTDPGAGRPACIGIQIGSAVGDFVAHNLIDVFCSTQESTNIAWNANNTGGNNQVRVKAYNTTTATYTGTIPASDEVILLISNSAGKQRINNKLQTTSLAIGSSASATWTFNHPFEVNPTVHWAPRAPSGALPDGIWISSIGTTSVTIYNSNAQTITLDLAAFA